MSFSRFALRASKRCSSMTTRSFSVNTTARSTYKAPALGVNKTYDEALKIIAEDKAKRLADIKTLEAKMADLLKAAPSAATNAEVAALKEQIFKQEAYSEINVPEIQWQFKNGQIDMSKAVFRYMKAKQFQRETLPVVQQRITQMFVTPDLLPPFTPSLDVQMDFGTEKKYFETGSYLLPGQTIQEPEIDVTTFHPEQKLYTIALIDPDVPDVEKQTFMQKLHWVISNVPLSATSTKVSKDTSDIILPYVPPHPAKGTKYHRYTLVVAEQPNQGQDKVNMNKEELASKDSTTTLAKLCSQYNLNVKGLTFFREVWDKDVSRIYKEILKQPEPVFGKQPKGDDFLDEAGQLKKKFAHLV
ncbi:hypothetical protein BGZ83_011947 [Gryganskiella cystojenkinii]|nr:hypothetical protein BGZ83_011947 [Gryganskiella cystojenkinii]